MTPLYRSAEAELRKTLSPNRFRHCLAVARFAAELAKRHGWDPEKARMAGLTHDCAKEWTPQRLAAHVRRRKLSVPGFSFILKTSPNLLHAYVSADVAREKGWLRTAEQVRAVAAHTLGSVSMGVAESVLFVADLASPDRRFREAPAVRRIARQDLRAGLRAALAVKLHYQLLKGKQIHPMPVQVWNWLHAGKPRGR